jgi:N-acetylmuramoyl-L-alanine amidase
MVKRPRPVWLFAIVMVALIALVRPAQAQRTDRDLYAAALARERAARAALADTNAPAESSLSEVRAAVTAYLTLPKRHPSSGYSDNALWQAGRLSLDAFARFGDDRDRKTGVQLLKRLAAAYPTSKMAKRVPAVIDAIGSADPETTSADRVAVPAPTRNVAAVAAPAVAIAGPTATIRGIKRTVLPDAVRIVIELDSEVEFHEERIASPDRLFLDLTPARASPALRNQTLRFQGDADVVRQIRLGSHENRTTRVVLDAGGVATYSVYAIYNPYRLVVDCVRGNAPERVRPLLDARSLAPTWTRRLPSVAPHGAATIREALAMVSVKSPVTPLVAPAPPPALKPIVVDESRAATARLTALPVVVSPPPLLAVRPLAPAWSRRLSPTPPRSTAAIEAAVASLPPPPPASPLGPGTVAPEKLPATTTSSGSTSTFGVASPPAKNSNGGFSIARQLGLGVSRIVIDPGHGGHDPGAMGKDVSEAELVLDVALRLEALLEKLPGVEVVLTRRTDDFVPLQERTAIANREGADLFLSIHANASESSQARGVETYFLNFANNLSAAGVAARENAASGQAMAALPDLVKMIALNNKLDESRDLAAIVQRSMIERLRGANKSLKDLGVKQAPFVVLIGAAMPSVLAEVSFVTNPQDAKQLRSSAYRQRIAEALLNGVRKYQSSLKSVSTVAHQ